MTFVFFPSALSNNYRVISDSRNFLMWTRTPPHHHFCLLHALMYSTSPFHSLFASQQFCKEKNRSFSSIYFSSAFLSSTSSSSSSFTTSFFPYLRPLFVHTYFPCFLHIFSTPHCSIVLLHTLQV